MVQDRLRLGRGTATPALCIAAVPARGPRNTLPPGVVGPATTTITVTCFRGIALTRVRQATSAASVDPLACRGRYAYAPGD